jgi:hypothetical protein
MLQVLMTSWLKLGVEPRKIGQPLSQPAIVDLSGKCGNIYDGGIFFYFICLPGPKAQQLPPLQPLH